MSEAHGNDGTNRVDFVKAIPAEVAEEIFTYLDPGDLGSCASTSGHWREAVNSDKVWGYQCEKNGWTVHFDPGFSHFSAAHRQFRRHVHTYKGARASTALSPICDKRATFLKHCRLRANWRRGDFVTLKIAPAHGAWNPIEPMACDGRYLVTRETTGSAPKLDVWSLDGAPSNVCNLRLPSDTASVDAIAFEHATVVIAQSWLIAVYGLLDNIFQLSYTVRDLAELSLHPVIPGELRNLNLKVTADSIVCVPRSSRFGVNSVPVFFWDRPTGRLVAKLEFDSSCAVPHAVWLRDSCYLSLATAPNACLIAQLRADTKSWGDATQVFEGRVIKLLACESFVAAVIAGDGPESTVLRLYRGGVLLRAMNMPTGSLYGLVDDSIVFFNGERVLVRDPMSDVDRLLATAEVVTSIRTDCHPSVVLINSQTHVEIWDCGSGTRLYSIVNATGNGSQVWCDDKRIVTYDPNTGGIGLVVLGFW